MMRFKLVIAAAAAIVSGVLLAGAPALAEQPTLMGSFKSWYVYSVGADVNRVCYALSQPSATLPKGARRDPIYILISTWPARGIRNEPSVVSGYPYKEGVPAQSPSATTSSRCSPKTRAPTAAPGSSRRTTKRA